MIHVSDRQVRELLHYREVTKALEEAFRGLALDAACVHACQRSECDGLRLTTTGAVWPAEGVAGVKVYSTIDGQSSFAIVLFDLATDLSVAILDGNEITRLRTASMTALVASKVALLASRKFALFGAGLQGRSQAQALCEVFDFEEVCIVDPMVDPAWCAQFQASIRGRVRVTGPEEAVRGADVVVTATRSSSPVFQGEWLSPGAFVAAMGPGTPKGRELDHATMARASRVIVEWKPESMEADEEIATWPGSRETQRFADLSELFRVDRPWQGDPHGVTVFKSAGVGLGDVATAHLAFKRLCAPTGNVHVRAFT